jgi:hypothetical protein
MNAFPTIAEVLMGDLQTVVALELHVLVLDALDDRTRQENDT